MRLVIQRVSRASVRVDGEEVGAVGPGLLVLLAIEKGDTEALISAAAAKTASLRIFPEEGSTRMNRSVTETGGGVLVVSQFTLAGSIRRGRRPSFDSAAPPAEAEALCSHFASRLESLGIHVATGRFGAMMEVELVNDGPVTIWMQSSPEGEIGP